MRSFGILRISVGLFERLSLLRKKKIHISNSCPTPRKLDIPRKKPTTSRYGNRMKYHLRRTTPRAESTRRLVDRVKKSNGSLRRLGRLKRIGFHYGVYLDVILLSRIINDRLSHYHPVRCVFTQSHMRMTKLIFDVFFKLVSRTCSLWENRNFAIIFSVRNIGIATRPLQVNRSFGCM